MNQTHRSKSFLWVVVGNLAHGAEASYEGGFCFQQPLHELVHPMLADVKRSCATAETERSKGIPSCACPSQLSEKSQSIGVTNMIVNGIADHLHICRAVRLVDTFGLAGRSRGVVPNGQRIKRDRHIWSARIASVQCLQLDDLALRSSKLLGQRQVLRIRYDETDLSIGQDLQASFWGERYLQANVDLSGLQGARCSGKRRRIYPHEQCDRFLAWPPVCQDGIGDPVGRLVQFGLG